MGTNLSILMGARVFLVTAAWILVVWAIFGWRTAQPSQPFSDSLPGKIENQRVPSFPEMEEYPPAAFREKQP